MTFWEKYEETTRANRSFVCLGLDSDLELLPDHLRSEESPILSFNKQIIEKTQDKVAAYKLNFAFYLSAGLKGIAALQDSIAAVPKTIPVIIDCKVGDIANTMNNYGRAFFDEIQADAITVNPLMGDDVLIPLLNFKGKFLFVLAVTSNPSAAQYLKKRGLYREVAMQINRLDYRQVGAVAGATNPQELLELRKIMPQTLFLIPGIGAQGGKLDEVMKNAICTKDQPQILINSSRGIIFKDRGSGFAEAASLEAEKLRQQINLHL